LFCHGCAAELWGAWWPAWALRLCLWGCVVAGMDWRRSSRPHGRSLCLCRRVCIVSNHDHRCGVELRSPMALMATVSCPKTLSL
jgi:hypothetical protein